MLEKAKNKRFWIILLLLLVFASGMGFLYFGKAKMMAQARERRWRVQTMTVEQGNYTPEAILYGEVYSPQRSTLAAALKDKIVALPVREGDRVEKGQLLLELDDQDLKLQVQQRQAQVARIEAQLKAEYEQYEADKKTREHLRDLVKTQQKLVERFRKLQARQHESEAQVDEALKTLYQQQINLRDQELAVANHPHRISQLRADLISNKVLLQQAEMDRADTRILAPFAGRIIEVLVAVGDDVADNQKLLSLYNLNDVELRARLPTSLIKALIHLPADQKLTAVPVDYPSYSLPLLRSGAALASGDVSIDVFFGLPAPLARDLPLGYTLSVRLLLPEEKTVIRIPAAALYGGERVYRVVDSRLQAVPVVRVGEQFEQNAHYYLIRSPDLPDGSLLLRSKLPNARDGLWVEMS